MTRSVWQLRLAAAVVFSGGILVPVFGFDPKPDGVARICVPGTEHLVAVETRYAVAGAVVGADLLGPGPALD